MSAENIVALDVALPAKSAEVFAEMEGDALIDTRNFPGCNAFRIQNMDEPTRFLFIESWVCEEAYLGRIPSQALC